MHLLIIAPSPLKIYIDNVLNFAQLPAAHKQNTTNRRRHGREERVIVTAITCFVSHRLFTQIRWLILPGIQWP